MTGAAGQWLVSGRGVLFDLLDEARDSSQQALEGLPMSVLVSAKRSGGGLLSLDLGQVLLRPVMPDAFQARPESRAGGAWTPG